MNVGIINVTGYAGMELVRLLYQHPGVKLTSVSGRSAVGKKLAEYAPTLAEYDLPIKPELEGSLDLVFSALPHQASAEALLPFIKKGVKVIDIAADFRLKDPAGYKTWYAFDHPAPELLAEAVYGIPELKRKQVASSRIVANPGCYPTSAILAMAPAMKHGLIVPDVIVDSKTGISGAGRTLTLETHFAEADENVSAYALNGHRHLPEITQELKELNPKLNPTVTFVPHLIPMTRGILSSCYATLAEGKFASPDKAKAEIRDIYADFYKGEPFVKVTATPPQTKQTQGVNLCLVYPTVDVRTNRLIVISCIDNLVKGAAGQAIQNMNLMLGLEETAGLRMLPMYP